MTSSTKLSLHSPEEEGFRKYHDRLLRTVSRPVELAEILVSEGVIDSDTKESVTANEDQKGSLFAALQIALAQSTDPEKTMRSLCTALEITGVATGYIRGMQEFIAGECNSVKASLT